MTGEILPFVSRPIASSKTEPGPCARMMTFTRMKYAIAAAKSTPPYMAVGKGSK
jgi:hypothetical protein